MANYTKESVTTEGSSGFSTKRETSLSQTLEYLVYLLFGILEILLAFRLVLRFLGANPSSDFVGFIYSVTRMFVLPFSGIFPAGFSQGVVATSVFEPATLIAMIVYAVLAWVIAAVIRIVSGQRPD